MDAIDIQDTPIATHTLNGVARDADRETLAFLAVSGAVRFHVWYWIQNCYTFPPMMSRNRQSLVFT